MRTHGKRREPPTGARSRRARVDRAKLDECTRGIEADLARDGYELVDVVLGKLEGRLVVELLVDREGGITNEDCGKAHETANNWFDAVDPVDGPYLLQVSSPGLDRPLRKPEHFARFMGSLVRLRVRTADGDIRRLSGRLAGSDGSSIQVCVDEELLSFPLSAIAEARLQYGWDELASRLHDAQR